MVSNVSEESAAFFFMEKEHIMRMKAAGPYNTGNNPPRIHGIINQKAAI
jgi:hypothetical protein